MRWFFTLALAITVIACADSERDDPTAGVAVDAGSTATTVVPEPTETDPTATVALADESTATSTVSVTITSATGAPAGGNAAVAVQTDPNIECTIRYTTPSGTVSEAEALIPKTSDANGVVSWEWAIGPGTNPGTGGVRVTCAGATATADIEIS